MITSKSACTMIGESFASVPYPGDEDLRSSSEGEEPYSVEAEFRGRRDWSTLSPEFIDQAPGGLGSALSFLSDAAFRFYIAAYMLADLDGQLVQSNPLFHLTHGLDDASRCKVINPRRYGPMTWFDRAQARFKSFDPRQREAVAAYLVCRRMSGDLGRREVEAIDQALDNFWMRGATELEE